MRVSRSPNDNTRMYLDDLGPMMTPTPEQTHRAKRHAARYALAHDNPRQVLQELFDALGMK